MLLTEQTIYNDVVLQGITDIIDILDVNRFVVCFPNQGSPEFVMVNEDIDPDVLSDITLNISTMLLTLAKSKTIDLVDSLEVSAVDLDELCDDLDGYLSVFKRGSVWYCTDCAEDRRCA